MMSLAAVKKEQDSGCWIPMSLGTGFPEQEILCGVLESVWLTLPMT